MATWDGLEREGGEGVTYHRHTQDEKNDNMSEFKLVVVVVLPKKAAITSAYGLLVFLCSHQPIETFLHFVLVIKSQN